MKLLFFLLITTFTVYLTTGRTTAPRRPQCVCSGKVSAIMQDASGTYCVYYGSDDGSKQWQCENEEEWTDYWSKISQITKEPRCQCTGDVTAIMQDETGTYCVFYSERENRHWECENQEEWELYRNKEY